MLVVVYLGETPTWQVPAVIHGTPSAGRPTHRKSAPGLENIAPLYLLKLRALRTNPTRAVAMNGAASLLRGSRDNIDVAGNSHWRTRWNHVENIRPGASQIKTA